MSVPASGAWLDGVRMEAAEGSALYFDGGMSGDAAGKNDYQRASDPLTCPATIR